jgi:TolB-like protein/class 3 adenylate cyclase/Tfp pilus assembly protein PilF
MSPSRRAVATVLFTDVVGSTEIAQRLGDRRWRDVLSQHHAFVRNELRRYQGEEIATAGDGFLAVFQSPALALLCAAAIRDAVRELGLEIRTGIHHGEIQREAGTVGGIGVHIGARVAALAGASEILVSGTVRDAVQGAGFEFEDRGEKELKGVTGSWHVYALTGTPEHLEDELLATRSGSSLARRLVLPALAVVAVAAALGFLVLRPGGDRSEATPPSGTDSLGAALSPIDRSIAVLPFDLRSSNEDDAFFARGMHDDLLTQLAQIDSLKVISRTSVERYAGTTTPVQQIGEELGVATVLEGAVQRSGDRIRLTVQLIDARKDEHLWAASYDEELTAANLFKIQTDLARRIAGALRARLRSAEEAALGAQPTESLEAYLHWARGVSIAESGFSRSDREVAAREFREAIQADSSYALAWAKLAEIELYNWFLGHRPAEEAFPAARSAVDRALALEPDLAIAHVISGSLYMIQWRFDEAEIAFLRAIELAPGLGLIHREYSGLLFVLERFEEAEVEAVLALELDPLNADLIQHLGWVRWAQRDWDGAIREAHRALEIDPNHSDAHNLLGNAYGRKGDHAAAIQAIETGRQRNPTEPWWTIALANAHARAGNRTAALRLLQRMPPDASNSPYLLLSVAVVYVTLGDADRAFALIDPLAQEDPYVLLYLGYDRDFDPIRNDPRFEDVRRRARAEVMRRNETY